jgi:hypothetical protein
LDEDSTFTDPWDHVMVVTEGEENTATSTNKLTLTTVNEEKMSNLMAEIENL